MEKLNKIFIAIILTYSLLIWIIKSNIIVNNFWDGLYSKWYVIAYFLTFSVLKFFIHYWIYRLIKWKENRKNRMIVAFTISTLIFLIVSFN